MSCGGKRREEVALGIRRPLLPKEWELLGYLTELTLKDRADSLRAAKENELFADFDKDDFEILIGRIETHLSIVPKPED